MRSEIGGRRRNEVKKPMHNVRKATSSILISTVVFLLVYLHIEISFEFK